MHPTSLVRPLALLLLAFAATGCASSVSIPTWQKSVTRYVNDKTDGDPMILRDMTIAGGRPGFAIIGHHDAPASVDANGVLLGHEQVAGRMWFVYLVGLVNKQEVKDVQLAALSMEDGKGQWKRGKGSKQSFRTYRDYGLKQARERFPGRKTPPPRYLGFPRTDDVFQLTNANGKLTATHEASGARWELAIANQKR